MSKTAIRRTTTKTYHATRGRLEISAPTAKDAKEKLEATIDMFLSREGAPVAIHYRGGCAFVYYNTVCGWCYVLHHSERADAADVDPVTCSGFRDVNDAVSSASYHVVQNQMDVHSVRSAEQLPDFLTPDQRTDLVRWARWQRAAHHAQHTLKLTSGELHRWACDHGSDPEFA